jgi:hypothetical protein
MPHPTSMLFAALDAGHSLKRIGGGSETDVYCSNNGRYAIKVKAEMGQQVAEARTLARQMDHAAAEFQACLGPQYTIPNTFLLAHDSQGLVHVVSLQPLFKEALPLAQLDYPSLSPAERHAVAHQLRAIMRLTLQFYYATGAMPDLYGRVTKSKADRQSRKGIAQLPCRLWGFLVTRSLLRSNNLLLTPAPESRIFLVDYDPVFRSWLYRFVYYLVRWLLFWRDQALILWMQCGGPIPT